MTTIISKFNGPFSAPLSIQLNRLTWLPQINIPVTVTKQNPRPKTISLSLSVFSENSFQTLANVDSLNENKLSNCRNCIASHKHKFSVDFSSL